MQYIKLPGSITESEALKIVQSQGFNNIISVNRDSKGNILIQAN